MSKVKFIYNPYSGEKAIISQIDKVIRIHQKYGYEVVPYRISLEYDLDDAFKSIDESYKYILVAGGDGTVDNVVNHLKNLQLIFQLQYYLQVLLMILLNLLVCQQMLERPASKY